MQELLGDDTETIEAVQNYASWALFALIFPIGIFFYRFFLAAKAKANAIRVGPKQMPELWALYQKLGEKLQISSLPKLYVTNGNGVVNAYCSQTISCSIH